MRAGPRPPTLRAIDRSSATRAVQEPLRITLDLDRDGQPPHGWLRVGEQQPREFDGYVQLISALESLRSGQRRAGRVADELGA